MPEETRIAERYARVADSSPLVIVDSDYTIEVCYSPVKYVASNGCSLPMQGGMTRGSSGDFGLGQALIRLFPLVFTLSQSPLATRCSFFYSAMHMKLLLSMPQRLPELQHQ
jgi:hypothetical protein